MRVAEQNIGECCDKSIKQLLAWIESLRKTLSKSQLQIGGAIIKEISSRLTFLDNVGLEYLTLSRASGTLSGGESQRDKTGKSNRFWLNWCTLCVRRAFDWITPER